MSFILMTDSSCNLPHALLEELQIPVVGTPFRSDTDPENEFRSTLDDGFDMQDFYERMAGGEVFKTSLISYAICERYIKPILEATDDDVLFVVFSSGLTASYEVVSAYFAEQQAHYPQRRLIAVDSLGASLGVGLLVYQAAELRQSGADIETVAAFVREKRLDVCHWFTVSDLKYLVRGGRVSGASAAVATVLDIKPVMHVDDEGKLVAVNKVRGRKKSLLALVDAFERTAFEPYGDQRVFIGHGNCADDAQFVADQISERCGVPADRFLLNFIDPVIGAHSGPGTVALFFTGSPR